MKGVSEVCECLEFHSDFLNYTTVISSTEIHANNCSPHKLNQINLEWPNILPQLTHHIMD